MIDDLFYGEVRPYERSFLDNPKLCAVMKTLVKLEKRLRASLSKKQLEAVFNFTSVFTELSALRVRIAFGWALTL